MKVTRENVIALLKNIKESAQSVFENEDQDVNEIIKTLANLELDEEEPNDEDMLPNGCLYIKGYLTTDWDGNPATSSDMEPMFYCKGDSIVSAIERYAQKNGFLREKTTGLGGRQSYIRNCNMRAFFSKRKCSLVEAHRNFDAVVYGGDLVTDTSYTGYSEWTITGLDLDEFAIGGHDLEKEFFSHMGEYVHLIIECK